MRNETQRIYHCYRCGRTFNDGEVFAYKDNAECYCEECYNEAREELSKGEQ